MAAIGEMLGGYRLEKELGRGAHSHVFLGVHGVLGRKAAIKVLAPSLADDPELVERLLREGRVVNDIRHPNIVDISDFIDTERPRRVALVMEYIEGPSLRALRGRPVTFGQAIALSLQLVAAIRAAHDAGVIHRDLKPDNLLLGREPWLDRHSVPPLKVVDFGLARDRSKTHQLATGTMLGTPTYMAPEQISGDPPPSFATDAYAIGEILFELLTGRRLFDTDNFALVIRAKLRGTQPDVQTVEGPAGEELSNLVRRCIARDPLRRPPLELIRAVLLEACPEDLLKTGTGTWGRNAEDAMAETVRLSDGDEDETHHDLPMARTEIVRIPEAETVVTGGDD